MDAANSARIRKSLADQQHMAMIPPAATYLAAYPSPMKQDPAYEVSKTPVSTHR